MLNYLSISHSISQPINQCIGQSVNQLLVRSRPPLPNRSLTHLLICVLAHSLTHSRTHSLTQQSVTCHACGTPSSGPMYHTACTMPHQSHKKHCHVVNGNAFQQVVCRSFCSPIGIAAGLLAVVAVQSHTSSAGELQPAQHQLKIATQHSLAWARPWRPLWVRRLLQLLY